MSDQTKQVIERITGIYASFVIAANTTQETAKNPRKEWLSARKQSAELSKLFGAYRKLSREDSKNFKKN